MSILAIIVLSSFQNNIFVTPTNNSAQVIKSGEQNALNSDYSEFENKTENIYEVTLHYNFDEYPTSNEFASDTGDPEIDYEIVTELSQTADPSVIYINDYAAQINNPPTESDDKSSDQLFFTKIFLNGSNEDISKLRQEAVLSFLTAINKMHLNLNKKLLIWGRIKNQTPVEKFKRSDLVNAGKLLLVIPEIDLYNFNYSNWEIIDFLGTLSGLSRRQAGIIGYAIKRQWGNDVISKVDYINRMKSIICAFSPQELSTITPGNFCKIEGEVFQYIKPCTNRQLQVLIHTAKLTTVFGPTQAWNTTITARLGLLLKALNEEDLKSIRPEAMEGISFETIEAMPRELLEIFDEDQISYLDDLALASYRRITGIDSNTSHNEKAAQISKFIIYGVIFLFYILTFTSWNC